MNATELAMAMLHWGELQAQADALAAEIQAAVLELGKTQTVGNVRASYYNGRTIYDYEQTVDQEFRLGTFDEAEFNSAREACSQVRVDWKGVFDWLNQGGRIQPIIKDVGHPSVSLKFVK